MPGRWTPAICRTASARIEREEGAACRRRSAKDG
jgi:hypothetical protein